MFYHKQPNEIAMPRHMLTDEHGSKIKAIMLKDRVYDKSEHRNTFEGILYRMRTGCPGLLYHVVADVKDQQTLMIF